MSEPRCCVCGGGPVVYSNYLDQTFCAPCADGKRLPPLGPRRPKVRINRHAIDHALHVAAWGSHVCRPFPVKA